MGLSIDREKIINEAFDEAITEVWYDDDYFNIGYNNGLEEGRRIALALLKEPEAVEPILSVKDRCYYCGNCDETEVKTYDHYCPRCGRALKWK